MEKQKMICVFIDSKEIEIFESQLFLYNSLESNNNKLRLITGTRRSGMSHFLAFYAVKKFIEEGARIHIVTPSYRQSIHVSNIVKKILTNLKIQIKEFAEPNLKEFISNNDNSIKITSAKIDYIRGSKIDYLLCDCSINIDSDVLKYIICVKDIKKIILSDGSDEQFDTSFYKE